jgi:hypothetical protein
MVRKEMRPISMTKSSHESMVNQEKTMCMRKRKEKSNADCHAWNLKWRLATGISGISGIHGIRSCRIDTDTRIHTSRSRFCVPISITWQIQLEEGQDMQGKPPNPGESQELSHRDQCPFYLTKNQWDLKMWIERQPLDHSIQLRD